MRSSRRPLADWPSKLARGEFDGAIEASRMAIALNPTLAMAHCSLAGAPACKDRHVEAMTCFERALALSPRDPQRRAFLTYGALALIAAWDFRAAAEWALRADAIANCSYWTKAHRTVALAGQGLLQEAPGMAARIEARRPGFSLGFAEEKLFHLDPAFRGAYLEGLARAGVAAGR